MYDYATSVYEKEKYAALTQKYRDSSLQHFPKQSRQHLIIQAELLIEKDKRTNHYNDYLLFSHYFSSDPDRAVLPTSFLMPIIKERQEREKRWLAISAFPI
jgi:hypothetical protein